MKIDLAVIFFKRVLAWENTCPTNMKTRVQLPRTHTNAHMSAMSSKAGGYGGPPIIPAFGRQSQLASNTPKLVSSGFY